MVKTKVEVSDEAWKVVTLVADRNEIAKSEALERILKEYASMKPEFEKWIESSSEKEKGMSSKNDATKVGE